MHKKKAPATKILVRNPEKPKPKTILINHYATAPQTDRKENESGRTTTEKQSSSERDSKIRFKSPEANSALVLARKIESLENLKPRKVQSGSSLSAEKLAIDEKLTKHMNFPVDQPIYKNLIPLCTTKQISQQQSLPASRPPLPNKDEEPCLSDFYTPKQNSEYIYKPSVANKLTSVVKDVDCLKLYGIMQTWSEI